MSQVQNEQAGLREIFRVIATTSEPRDCYLPMLEASIQLVGADSAFLLLFDEPRLLLKVGADFDSLPDDEALINLVHSLESGPQSEVPLLSAYWPAHILTPITVNGELVGLWLLVFDDRVDPRSVDHETIAALTDSFIVVTKSVRTKARHEKLGRNQSEFMRIVSHDLRSPLTAIQGFCSMLEMVGDLNERQTHFTEKIFSGITQMTALVDNIQDAGRYDPETGFYEMQRAPCDLAEIVNRIVENHLVPGEKQELIVRKHIDDVPIINVDATMLERAITNLVDNAIKYTPNGRDVTVSLYREGDSIIISVRDSGLGISAENQKMLFERHSRIPRKEHKRVKGSGLGLFIVRSVARRHRGDAWVESVEGEGSIFYISIPLISENLLVGD